MINHCVNFPFSIFNSQLLHRTQKRTPKGSFSVCIRLLLNIIKQSGKIKRCKVVLRGLCAADHLYRAVLAKQQLCGTQLCIIVIAHREAVRAGIVDINVIADVNLRQIAVNSKLVVIFAQTAGHVVGMIAQRVFLAEHGDMVVCAIHRRQG